MAKQKTPKKPKWILRLYYAQGSPVQYGFNTKQRAKQYADEVLKADSCVAAMLFKADEYGA